MSIKAKLKNNILTVSLPLRGEPKVSGSGKNIVVASARGRLGVDWEGQELYLITNVLVRNSQERTETSPRSTTKKKSARHTRP